MTGFNDFNGACVGCGENEANCRCDDDFADDLDCTWCCGEGVFWGSELPGYDPGWHLPDELYPCPACKGTGSRREQVDGAPGDHTMSGRDARAEVQRRLPGVHKILTEMRNSGDPDRLADGAFLLGMFDAMADVMDETVDALRDAATVIERMANGAARPECSPELDRVIALLWRLDGDHSGAAAGETSQ